MSERARSTTDAADRARWTSRDGWALALVTVVGGLVRCWHLTVPGRIVFDEVYYAQDACVFVKPASVCGIASPLSEEHPLLAKWLIAAGIRMFGYEPFGWRVMPAVAGVAGIALTFLLARRLLRSTLAATLAAGLLAADGMHVVLSRTAMLDVFVTTFSVATILFVVLDRDRDRGRRDGERLRDRPWLAAAGAAGGAAAASKWSGIPFLLVAIVLILAWDRAAARERGATDRWATVRADLAPVAVFLVALPLVVYVLSFAGRLDGRVLALPWDQGSWAWAFLRRQGHILTFHAGLGEPHPYGSPAWSWPLLKRPVVFAFDDAGGAIREILAIGNPVVWWGGSVSALICAVRWARGGGRRWIEPEGVVLAGVAAGYLWWLPVTSVRPFSFLFYLLPALPFLCVAVARIAQLTWSRASGRVLTAGLTAAAIGWLVLFLPVLTFRPLDPQGWNSRIWFSDCRPEALTGDPPRPRIGLVVAPPTGWCWR
jgi:dolichyl-phosphate-mannose--protein O-mannosyl transferase